MHQDLWVKPCPMWEKITGPLTNDTKASTNRQSIARYNKDHSIDKSRGHTIINGCPWQQSLHSPQTSLKNVKKIQIHVQKICAEFTNMSMKQCQRRSSHG